jgi:hypothetical protein
MRAQLCPGSAKTRALLQDSAMAQGLVYDGRNHFYFITSSVEIFLISV